MVLRDMSACAMQEIANLRQDNTALESLTQFCQRNLGTSRPKFGGSHAAAKSLYSFYLFSGDVNLEGTGTSSHLNSGYGPNWKRMYAHEFAALIRANQLGEVWESPRAVNKAFHSDHANQMFVWMPDRDALVKWWDTQPKPVPVRPTVTGNWKIGILKKPGGMACTGPVVGDQYLGCGMKFANDDVVFLQLTTGNKPTGLILCRICAVITEEEANKAEPLPEVKNGWTLEKSVPSEAAYWSCNGGCENGSSGKRLYNGCSNSISGSGGPVYIYYTSGHPQGYILCSKCTKKYELDKPKEKAA